MSSTKSDAAERSRTTKTTRVNKRTVDDRAGSVSHADKTPSIGATRNELNQARALIASYKTTSGMPTVDEAAMCVMMELHAVTKALEDIRSAETHLSIEGGRKRKRGETNPEKFPVGHPLANEYWPQTVGKYSKSSRDAMLEVADAIRTAIPHAFLER
jgi:hypothetical protein